MNILANLVGLLGVGKIGQLVGESGNNVLVHWKLHTLEINVAVCFTEQSLSAGMNEDRRTDPHTVSAEYFVRAANLTL